MSKTAKIATFKNESDGVDAIRDDLEALRSDFTKLLRTLREHGREDIVALASDASDVIAEKKESVSSWASGTSDKLREVVREEPLQACAIALGIGTVLGALVTRR